jgi:curli production assembly/transport component CsgG
MDRAMKKTILALAVISMLAGCSTISKQVRTIDQPEATQPVLLNQEQLLPPQGGAITVAVYSFRDLTGQRKASQTLASLSSAVTQGADNYLIRSLQEVGNGSWFKVVERGGLDNIVKERQLIRQMRELYQGKDAQALPPMVFAGLILEGGIVGYDSNVISGGSGARLLGIGASTEYRQDEIVISLRAVSVASGEVLTAVTIKKTVVSFQDKMGVLRFYDLGTKALELETGAASNESMNSAVQLAIHAAVIEMIKQGEKKGHWQYRKPVVVATPLTETPKVEPKKEEVKVAPAPAASPVTEKKIEKETPPSPTTEKVVPQQKAVPIKKTGEIKDWSNLRSQPITDSEKTTRLEPGSRVVVLEKKRDWVFVEYSGNTGWVHKSRFSRLDD